MTVTFIQNRIDEISSVRKALIDELAETADPSEVEQRLVAATLEILQYAKLALFAVKSYRERNPTK